MKRLILVPLLLLLSGNSPAQTLPSSNLVIAYSEIDTGTMPGIVYGFVHLESSNIPLGPMASMLPPLDKPGNGIGNGGSTIQSEWMSGNVKRTITTKSPPGRQGRRLALSRHNDLVLEALKYWPQDP